MMPGNLKPKVNEWLGTVSNNIKNPDKESYFIGHSLGCIAILRYLEKLPKKVKVGGFVLISGFASNINIPEIQDFYSLPLDLKKIKEHTSNFVVIPSDNHEIVTLEKEEELQLKLNAKFILEHNKGHIDESAGIKDLPNALG